MEEESREQAWARYCNGFSNHLQDSKAVLGNGSSWQGHSVRELSTGSCFERDPALVWSYYRHRQEEILTASPNAGHIALARLAFVKKDSLTITQNVDGLSQRAGHPSTLLIPIHGSIFDLQCTSDSCEFHFQYGSENSKEVLRTLSTFLPVPICPRCGALLRPAIVRFGDQLHSEEVDRIEQWFAGHSQIDLMLVVGCAATVSPAADYIDRAKEQGARVAVFNLSFEQQSLSLGPEDWFFPGDASVSLPLLLHQTILELAGETQKPQSMRRCQSERERPMSKTLYSIMRGLPISTQHKRLPVDLGYDNWLYAL